MSTVGCSERSGEGDGAPQASASERQPDQIYVVRGQIAMLPDPENPSKSLQIQHENIPDFVNKAGETSGMKPMAMPFTPAPDVDLSGLAIGDKVRFTFDVDWDGSPLFLLTEIEPLAPETQLDFSSPG